jgi:hypothetical protein
MFQWLFHFHLVFLKWTMILRHKAHMCEVHGLTASILGTIRAVLVKVRERTFK